MNVSPRAVAILPVIGGRVHRSYRYSQRRPGPDLASCIRTLDRWEMDEIIVINIDRSGRVCRETTDIVSKLSINTPLAYGGGISNWTDIHSLMQCGFDRFVLENAVVSDSQKLQHLAEKAGTQALIASLPASRKTDGRWYFTPTRSQLRIELREHAETLLGKDLVSELLVVDRNSEGHPGEFDLRLADNMTGIRAKSVIWFGGVDIAKGQQLQHRPETAGLGIGHGLFEKEVGGIIFTAGLKPSRRNLRDVKKSFA